MYKRQIYAVCAAFRLARFNVQIGSVDKRYFIGLASPLAAAIIASMVWAGFDNQLPNKLTEFAIAASIITVFSGFLMVSNFKFYSFKELDRGRVPFAVMLPVVLVIGIVAYDLPRSISRISCLCNVSPSYCNLAQNAPSQIFIKSQDLSIVPR